MLRGLEGLTASAQDVEMDVSDWLVVAFDHAPLWRAGLVPVVRLLIAVTRLREDLEAAVAWTREFLFFFFGKPRSLHPLVRITPVRGPSYQ